MKKEYVNTAVEELNGVFVESTVQEDDGSVIIKGHSVIDSEVVEQEFQIKDNVFYVRTV